MNKMTDKKDKLTLLARSLTGWMSPATLNKYSKWAKDNSEHLIEEVINIERYDNEDDAMEAYDEWCDDEVFIGTILMLYDKGMLKDKDIKELLGREYASNCFGKWRDQAKKLWDITFR